MKANLPQLLIASIGLLMVVDVALLLIAFHAARFGFGGYLKRQHADQWRRLVTRDSRLLSPLVGPDSSSELRRFRLDSREDLGDPELSHRRKRANRLERFAVYSWIGTAVWAAAVFAILVLRGGGS